MGHVQGTPPLRRRPRSPTMVSYCCGKRPTMLSWIMAAFAASCTSSSVASGLPYLHQPLTCCKDVQPAIKACSCRQSAVKASTRLPWCTVRGKGLGLHQACMHAISGLDVTAACAAAVCRTGHAGRRPPDVVQDGVVEQDGVLRDEAHVRAQGGLHAMYSFRRTARKVRPGDCSEVMRIRRQVGKICAGLKIRSFSVTHNGHSQMQWQVCTAVV